MNKRLGLSAIVLLICSPLFGQQENPVLNWATLLALSYHIDSNAVDKRANNFECKLDVISARDTSQAEQHSHAMTMRLW